MSHERQHCVTVTCASGARLTRACLLSSLRANLGIWRCIMTRTSTVLSSNVVLGISTFWIIGVCRCVTTDTTATQSGYSLWGTSTTFRSVWMVGTWCWINCDIDGPLGVLGLWAPRSSALLGREHLSCISAVCKIVWVLGTCLCVVVGVFWALWG